MLIFRVMQMKFTAWEARRHIEASYKSALFRLGKRLEAFTQNADSVSELIELFNQYSQTRTFGDWAQALAHTFVTHTLEENARTWRQAAAKAGQGGTMRRALENEMYGPVGRRVDELIAENANYIKSVPLIVGEDLTKHIQSKAFAGSRVAYKSDEFKAMVGEMSQSHARMISRTETSKAMSALTQARAEYTGHDWYIWHTSEDGRVRESHRNMDGVLCRFSDPPAPEELVGEKSAGKYSPGNIYNCRCYAEPIILWDEIEWPRRVYVDGQITQMTKTQFKTRFGSAAA